MERKSNIEEKHKRGGGLHGPDRVMSSGRSAMSGIASVVGNAAMLQMEGISDTAVKSLVVQRWERDAGHYDNTTLYGVGTGVDPAVSQSQYVATVAGGQNLVLGWNSMVVFTENAGVFQIGNVVSDDQQYPVPLVPPQTVESVVTRGVASCTAVLVSNGNNIALFHLDESWLPWGLEQLHGLNTLWQANGGIRNIFISYTDDRGFESKAFNFANHDISRQFPGAQVSRLNRGILDETNAIHSEIGLGHGATGQLEVFGDMLSPEVWHSDELHKVCLGQMNSNPDAPDFSRFLFQQPYPNPNIVKPWPDLVPVPGLVKSFIDWMVGIFQ